MLVNLRLHLATHDLDIEYFIILVLFLGITGVWLGSMSLSGSSTLEECLGHALPEACRFSIHHLSTPPTCCPAIFAAPPGEHPEETYCESHFLSISIDHNKSQLQVYAIEVLIYTTEYLTTLFVSKADSTGYLYLLELPYGTSSPLRIISTTFLQYLIERRKRTGKKLVLSLFARAQNQYLFPGSIENIHKHVLDDRGLIKWWCKVADPLLHANKISNDIANGKQQNDTTGKNQTLSRGYLRVPGCDKYETEKFVPKRNRDTKAESHRWTSSDPLRDLREPAGLPERCLIPRFPDDPKARFVETLDDEVPDEELTHSPSQLLEDPFKKQSAGRWRSVRSLEQFWELMQFRQECSSGRLVGFLWATFQQANSQDGASTTQASPPIQTPADVPLPTPEVSQQQSTTGGLSQLTMEPSPIPRLSTETPPVSPKTSSPALSPVTGKEATIRALPVETKYIFWPELGRGEILLTQKDYDRVGDQLLRMDYADVGIARDSTRKWINDVAEKAGVLHWGRRVIGSRSDPVVVVVNGSANPTLLNAGLIRKKKRPVDDTNGKTVEAGQADPEAKSNMLSANLIRKRVKVINDILKPSEEKQSKSKAEFG